MVPGRPTPADYVWAVWRASKLTYLFKCNTREAIKARWAVAYLLRYHTALSYTVIGRVMGQDHSSIQHGVRRACELMENDIAFKRLVLDSLEFLEEVRRTG